MSHMFWNEKDKEFWYVDFETDSAVDAEGHFLWCRDYDLNVLGALGRQPYCCRSEEKEEQHFYFHGVFVKDLMDLIR